MSAVARVLCAAAAVACVVVPSATASKAVRGRSSLRLACAARRPRAVRRARRADAARASHRGRRDSARVGRRPVLRRALTVEEPALAETYLPGIAWEWQWDAARMGEVPDWVLRAAAGVTIGVVDSGADLSAPDLADKSPSTWSVFSRSHRVRDVLGHGTFVVLPRGRLGRERDRHLRVRRRREAARRPGDRLRRLHHRRRRGCGDRLRRQARRAGSSISRSAARRPRPSSSAPSAGPRGTAP